MCLEAKRGNVGAFRAIAQVMGELREVVEMPDLPPPFVIELHDPAFVEAERRRQEAAMAQTMEAVGFEPPTGAKPPESGRRATQDVPGGAGRGHWGGGGSSVVRRPGGIPETPPIIAARRGFPLRRGLCPPPALWNAGHLGSGLRRDGRAVLPASTGRRDRRTCDGFPFVRLQSSLGHGAWPPFRG